jgi:hypothetical protein
VGSRNAEATWEWKHFARHCRCAGEAETAQLIFTAAGRFPAIKAGDVVFQHRAALTNTCTSEVQDEGCCEA